MSYVCSALRQQPRRRRRSHLNDVRAQQPRRLRSRGAHKGRDPAAPDRSRCEPGDRSREHLLFFRLERLGLSAKLRPSARKPSIVADERLRDPRSPEADHCYGDLPLVPAQVPADVALREAPAGPGSRILGADRQCWRWRRDARCSSDPATAGGASMGACSLSNAQAPRGPPR